jgi:hypothetical protein
MGNESYSKMGLMERAAARTSWNMTRVHVRAAMSTSGESCEAIAGHARAGNAVKMYDLVCGNYKVVLGCTACFRDTGVQKPPEKLYIVRAMDIGGMKCRRPCLHALLTVHENRRKNAESVKPLRRCP